MLLKYLAILSLFLLPQEIFFAEIQPENDFGYHIGDIIKTRVKVKLPNNVEIKDYQTSREIIPDLEFRDTEITREGDVYLIEINYQSFHVPEDVIRINIPKTKLRLKSTEGWIFEILIPTRTARISPLLQYPETVTKTPVPIKFASIRDLMSKLGFQGDSQPMKTYDSKKLKFIYWTSISFSLGLFAFLVFLTIRHRIEFHKSPFAKALKELKAIQKHTASHEARLVMELKVFQEAISDKAKQIIFLHNLNSFLRTLERNRTLEENMRKIYEVSEEIFFKDTLPTNPKEKSELIWNSLRELAKGDYEKAGRIRFK